MHDSWAKTYVLDLQTRVNAYLKEAFASPQEPAVLFDAMNYSLLANGKRLRPILCLATARTLGVAEETAMPAAAALEMIHCYSLIHDDLPCMDDDDLRRGRPTNHKVFGEAMALLAGDALLTAAFSELSKPMHVPPERQLQMIRVLSRAAGCEGMVGGQAADLLAEHQAGTVEQLRFIHVRKTAMLLQASVEIGTLFGDIPEHTRAALLEFGQEVGLAFQMVDDLLDVVGDTATMGKTAGSDARLEKLTYPALVGIERTREFIQSCHQRAKSALQQSGLDAPLLAYLADYIVHRAY
ncbi:MAG: polyprenyl synthetase family protein [Alicyclobacillus sp.]|nr:polyprenyl synthetase family protein [Alicyclobacillus sp.]